MAEERMLITGGQRLEGAVRVSGGKNTAVAIIPAAILSQTPCVIENLPDIEDVHVSIETLRYLGARVDWDPEHGIMQVDASSISRTDVPLDLCRRMRASSYYIGALLARMPMVEKVRVLPYNNLAGSKYTLLGMENTMPACQPPAEAELSRIRTLLASFSLQVI